MSLVHVPAQGISGVIRMQKDGDGDKRSVKDINDPREEDKTSPRTALGVWYKKRKYLQYCLS